MSIKQRAVQCSAHIPPSQYVPVYSRPQWARRHEELSPITPRPTCDDPQGGRTQIIHEAVKQWLECSPKSVIGPTYRTRSPSSSSPPPSRDSVGGQGGARASKSPAPACTRALNASSNPVRVADGTDKVNTVERVDKANGNVAMMEGKEKHARQDDEGQETSSDSTFDEALSIISLAERSWSQRGLGEASLVAQHLQLFESSDDSDVVDLREFSSGRLSREFDCVLAAAAIASEACEEVNPIENGAIATIKGPEVHLKPPRGHEMSVMQEDENSSEAKVIFHRPSNATDDGSRSVHGEKAATPARCPTPLQIIDRSRGDEVVMDSAGRSKAATPASTTAAKGRAASTSKRTDESHLTSGKARAKPQLVRDILEDDSFVSAESAPFKLGDVLTGIPSSTYLRGDSSKTRTESQAGSRTESPYFSGGSFTNFISPQAEGARGGNRSTTATPEDPRRSISAKANERHKNPAKAILEQARWTKRRAKVAEWEVAKAAPSTNSHKVDESKIQAWEQQKIAKASVAFGKLEAELEKRRAKATEKMEQEVAAAQKKAKAMKANAEAKRAQKAEKAANAALQAHIYRVVGKSPLSCFCF